MNDATIQKKLNQLTKIANELDAEARIRWSGSENDGCLFFESDGSFHMMSGDSDGGSEERQAFAEFTSKGHCTMGAGAW